MNRSFVELGINKDLERVLEEERIFEPRPIQEVAIPEILLGNDIVGQAQTGTGKALAFLLPIFERIDLNIDQVQGLIITPTRELAIQITNEAAKLKKYKDINILDVYGGVDTNRQIRKLKRGIDLIIATPGRLLDHIERGSIDLSNLRMLVIDEADEIMNMGFFNDIESIIERTPKTRQTLLFSATIPENLDRKLNKIMINPKKLVAVEEDILENQIEEIVIYTTHRKKLDDLCNYLDENRPFMGIIFCRTKRRVRDLTTNLKKRGYNVDELHGDMSQAKRERAMKRFRNLETQYLIATDIAARGLDIDGVTHVFNYDEPEEKIKYIHRIGRTGRAGDEGVAVTFKVRE